MAEFKAKEQFLQTIECELYLIAISLQESEGANIKEFDKKYDKVMETAKVHGLEMKGRFIG